VADFLARASACSLPILPAWDFTLKKWMGDGDWRWSPWMWSRRVSSNCFTLIDLRDRMASKNC